VQLNHKKMEKKNHLSKHQTKSLKRTKPNPQSKLLLVTLTFYRFFHSTTFNHFFSSLEVWNRQDEEELLNQIEKCLPDNDAKTYTSRVNVLKWEEVSFIKLSTAFYYSSSQLHFKSNLFCRLPLNIILREIVK